MKKPRKKPRYRYFNKSNDFVGERIGSYKTREGERGYVLQQIGTRVVHVYRVKYLERHSV